MKMLCIDYIVRVERVKLVVFLNKMHSNYSK